MAVPDRGADDRAAAHRVAAQVEVDAVAAQIVFFAEVAKLGVTDRTGRVLVIHGVAAHPVRIGRFDHDVAREVGDFAPETIVREVGESQRLVEFDWVTAGEVAIADGDDAALFIFGSGKETAASAFAFIAGPVGAAENDLVACFQSATGSASERVLAPASACFLSLTQVCRIGAPWISILPPQQTRAGHDSLSMPST